VAGESKSAANWLANPAVPWVAAGLAVALLIWWLPQLLGRIFKATGDSYNAAKKGATTVATDIIDTGANTIGQISSIVGKPSTEAPAGVTPGVSGQSFTDKLKGLLAGGDSRTWSDLFG
jgi:hypothetical protein